MQENLVRAIQHRKLDFDVEKAFGSEPSFAGITGYEDNFRTIVGKALNWANAALDHDELKRQTFEFLIANNRPTEHLIKMASWKFMLAGKLAFLFNIGCPQVDPYYSKLILSIDTLSDDAKTFVEEVVVEDDTKPKLTRSENKAAVVSKKASDIISLIDELIDTSILTDNTLSESEIYHKLNSDKVDVKVVESVYNKLKIRHRVVSDEEDSLSRMKEDVIVSVFDEKEVFDRYLDDITRHVNAIVSVLNQIGSYLGNKKALKKSERKLGGKIAVKRIENQVSKLNFKVHDNTYQISSISPASIIGSPTLVVFNVTNRKLSVYIAADEKGLDIKGTTVYNYDEERSYQKLLKRTDFLKHIQTSSLARLKYVVSNTNAKTDKVTGRINEHTVLLKTYKEVYSE